MAKNPFQAYHQATHTVPKTRQVVMLYDGIIRNLSQAKEAMKEGQIETRYHKLVRASEIITGLQMSLDFEQGEGTARILYDFYSFVDARIISLHRTNDLELCDHLIKEIKDMRELWHRIDVGHINENGELSDGEQSNAPLPFPRDIEFSIESQEEQATNAAAEETYRLGSRNVAFSA